MMITLNDLMHKVLEIFPDAIIEENADLEIIISTGLRVDKNDKLLPIEEEDE